MPSADGSTAHQPSGHTGPSRAGQRVLVTGGSGFIGTNLVQRYLDADVAVCSVDSREPQHLGHRSVWVGADVRSADALTEILRAFRPTHLVHLAAATGQFGRSMAYYDVNTVGVQAILDAIAAYGRMRRSVFTSSRLVCQFGVQPVSDMDYCPPNRYGRSKVIGEQLVRRRTDIGEWVIVRPTSIWGPWGEEPYRPFFVSLAKGRYVQPAGQQARKHYGYVGNTVHQVDRLLLADAARVHGRTLYLADPEPTGVRTFARLIRRRMGLTGPREVPVSLLRLAALAGDAVQATGRVQRFPLSSERLAHLRSDMLFDLKDVADVVGPLPYSLADGVDATIRHLRERGYIPAADVKMALGRGGHPAAGSGSRVTV